MTTNWLIIADSHNVWLKDYPYLLLPLMLGVGIALITIGFAGVSIRAARRKNGRKPINVLVLILAVLVGIFLIGFALWIFVAVYLPR